MDGDDSLLLDTAVVRGEEGCPRHRSSMVRFNEPERGLLAAYNYQPRAYLHARA